MPTNALTGYAPPGNALAGTSSQYAGMTPEQIVKAMSATGLTQAGVDAVYAARNLGPAPVLTADQIGAHRGLGRDAIAMYGADDKPLTGGARGAANDFLNNFNTLAVDPYRVRSGISNFAGGVLNAVGTYVGGPVWQAFTAAADAGNKALGHDDGTSYTDGRRSSADRIGAAVGAVAGSMNGPGSYGANNPTAGTAGTGGSGTGGTGGSGAGAGGNVLGAGGNMGWSDWVNLAGQAYGAYAEGQGAKDAANAQAAGSAAGIAEQRRQFDLSRADQAPWLASGVSALGRLNDPNAFTQSPGYQFTRDEAFRDIGNQFSARGGAQSGNALRALQDRGAQLGSLEYNNWFNQQSNLAGLGQSSAQSLGALGQNNANSTSNLLGQQGNARASGIAGQTNALTGGISDLLSWYNRRNPSGTGGGGGGGGSYNPGYGGGWN